MSENQTVPAGSENSAGGVSSNESQNSAPNDVQAILKKQAELLAELKSSKAKLKNFKIATDSVKRTTRRSVETLNNS